MIDIYTPRTMLRVLEQLKPARNFLRATFINEVNVSTAETVDMDIVKAKRRLAPFVNPKHQGKLIEREGYATKTFKPAYIKPKMVTTADDVLKRSPGETIYMGKTPEMRAMELLGKDLAEMDTMISRREEWMAAQALFTGKMDVIGDGVNYQVDFGYEAGVHILTLGTGSKWGDNGVNPMTDLYEWSVEVGQRSGFTPTMAILGSGAAQALLDSVDVKAFDYRRTDMGQIQPQQLPNGVMYLGHFRRPDLDLYQYNEWYLDDTTGEEKPMVPENAVLLANPAARCIMHYGAIKDLKGLAAVARFPKSWEEDDPSARYLMLQSAPLFNPVQVDAFLVATVK